MDKAGWNLGGDKANKPLIPRRNLHDDAEFDITAMIDLVFMMNIYFLVTYLTAAMGEVDLPTANNPVALDMDTAIVITVREDLNDETVTVYLGDGEEGEPLRDAEAQSRQVRQLAEQAIADGKTAVLFKAERNVCLRHMYRLMSAAKLEKLKLHVAVMEMDEST